MKTLRSIVNFSEAASTVVGVNITSQDTGSREISYCVLRRARSLIVVEEKKSAIADVMTLCQYLRRYIEKEVPVCVNFIGRSVLSKKFNHSNPDTGGDDVSKWFPGLKNADFVSQRDDIPSDYILHVMRREELFRDLGTLGPTVVSVTLGPMVLDVIAPFVGQSEIVADRQLVKIDNGRVIAINANSSFSGESNYDVGGEKLSIGELLAYASASGLFLKHHVCPKTPTPDIRRAAERFEFKRNFFVAGRFALVTLLLVLVANAIVYFSLATAIVEKKSLLGLYRGRMKKDEIEKGISKRVAQTYDALGWTLNRLPLFYADQVAQTVPADVKLAILEVGVLDDRSIRTERTYRFDSETIRVRGESTDALSLSKWTTDLKDLSWIDEVKVLKYEFDPRIQKGVFEFTIKIR